MKSAGRAAAGALIAVLLATGGCSRSTPPSLEQAIPDEVLVAAEMRCGGQRLLHVPEGERLRLTSVMDAALVRARPVRLSAEEARSMMENGWSAAARPAGERTSSASPARREGAIAVASLATLRLPPPPCAELPIGLARLTLALKSTSAESEGAVEVGVGGRKITEAVVAPGEALTVLDAPGALRADRSPVELRSAEAGTVSLEGIALPMGPASVEIGHEYREAIPASSMREVAFRIVVPPSSALRFALAIDGGGAAAPPREGGWRFTVASSGVGGERELFREQIGGGAAGSWADRTVDLSPLADQEISLQLRAEPVGVAPPIALWGSPVIEPASPGEAARPNVLLISVDTLRADRVGRVAAGVEITPRLSELARAGTIFTGCRTQAPSTLYGHGAILTGLPPSAHGATTTSMLPAESPYLPDLLARAGYATVAMTDDGLLDGRFGLARGFDRFFNRFEPVDTKVSAAIETIDALPSPWFLFLHTYAVHVPYEPDESRARRLDPGYTGGLGWKLDALTMTRINNGVVPMTPADVRHVEELYDALVSGADAALGRLFGALRSRGLLDSTIVVVTSDHGEEFDEHGVIGWHALTCYDEVQRAALIVKPSGPAPAERRVEAAVRSIDIAPTILELAGVPIPEAMWGRTLSGLMAGAREPEREALCEIEDGRGAAILAGRWKYHVRTPESAADPRTFRRRLQTHGRYGTEELYDLSRDPFEQVNLAASDPDRARELRALLEKRLAAARGAFAAAMEGRAAPPRPREDDEHMKRLRALGYVQ